LHVLYLALGFLQVHFGGSYKEVKPVSESCPFRLKITQSLDSSVTVENEACRLSTRMENRMIDADFSLFIFSSM